MIRIRPSLRTRLLGGAALATAISCAAPALAESKAIDIEPQPLTTALYELGVQTGEQIIFSPDLASAKMSQGARGEDTELALNQLLAGTGLTFERTADAFMIKRAAADPQSQGAAGDGADGTVEALVVTAQKREEDIQDVPIAISAFTQEDLTRSQVAGGPDLMTQVPNMTFTKTNFTSYSIQIRGIGTQAISATTDAAVAVAFNNTPFIRNRFFEQEFYDLQRVEVLRGPQGTLYGRNATAGVVNIISAKPTFSFAAKASGDVSNYKSTRVEGMVNVPLVEDAVALRLAGAWTKRDGYVTNGITGNPIDGRDLWSTRVSLRFAPTDAIDANLIWEHFEEDDDRLRSGKQLCHTHEITQVGDVETTHDQGLPGGGQSFLLFNGVQATFSQGCAAASLYAPESFETPNGLSLPYYAALVGGLGLPGALADPYASRFQSRDLRVVESTVDPQYRAESDLMELQVSVDLTDGLTIASETAYSADTVFSTQDFNRFNTVAGAWAATEERHYTTGLLTPGPNGDVFCDPQVGCADRLVAVDLSTAKSHHFSQEFRLSSDFEGPFNFSLGANWLRYDTEDKYYVFINSLTMLAADYGASAGLTYVPGESNQLGCLRRGRDPAEPGGVYPVNGCNYIDPNPIGSLNDEGHNYFLSRNPYKLISYAVFGEAYYNVTDNLKVTGGLRWTVDKKEAPRIPSMLLVSETTGYPTAEVIRQEWREPTGRLAIDWKPDLPFTDETLLYGSLARGYKAGGSNPPNYTFVYYGIGLRDISQSGSDQSATRPKTFAPEYVNAFEVGAKNTLADGRVTLNLAAFYYDYTGYQISEIVDRSAFNRNFDATVWGLEIEADWRPLENLRLGFKGGYENTRLADGSRAVDLMDRTAGHDDWVVVSPHPTTASNCVLPIYVFMASPGVLFQPGQIAGGGPSVCELAYALNLDPVSRLGYVADPEVAGDQSYLSDYVDYRGFNPLDESQGHNHGEGFFKDLSGNELPNAPNFTATITADYTVPIGDWLATLHTDLYYQSEAWWRIFNTDGYDKLKAYTNVNLAAIFTNEDAGWKVMAYVKNVFDRDSVTGAFLNSDDTGLTTNVFLTEPRLYGVRVTKDWNGGSPFGTFGQRSTGPYPLTVEVSGQAQRHDAPYETMTPGFAPIMPDVLDPTGAQNRDLDWGDGRELKLTLRPGGSAWFGKVAVRYGRTNSDLTQLRLDTPAGGPPCGMVEKYADLVCNPDSAKYDPFFVNRAENWSNADVMTREKHGVVDFAVGRDFGLGDPLAIRSSVSLGLRFAKLESVTDAAVDTIPNWYLPEGWTINPAITGKYSSHDRYMSTIEAQREFEGGGPTLSWDAAGRLFDGGDIGRIDLDWSLGGGVLFGKQTTRVTGEEMSGHFEGFYGGDGVRATPLTDVVVDRVHYARSQSVSVPMFDMSVGLSYNIDRVRIGAGYRWERYFDALDAGVAEEKSFDRTIDGPYFKLSVGFGG